MSKVKFLYLEHLGAVGESFADLPGVNEVFYLTPEPHAFWKWKIHSIHSYFASYNVAALDQDAPLDFNILMSLGHAKDTFNYIYFTRFSRNYDIKAGVAFDANTMIYDTNVYYSTLEENRLPRMAFQDGMEGQGALRVMLAAGGQRNCDVWMGSDPEAFMW
ncbi:unnamed protein product, partial [marine sediment metagenome]